MAAMGQYSQRSYLVISGIPVIQNENVCDIFKTTAAQLKIGVEDYDFEVVTRLLSNRGDPAIIAKSNNREKKDAIVKASRKAKLDSTFLRTDTMYPIYCEDPIIPVLTYGAQTWAYMKKQIQKIIDSKFNTQEHTNN